MNTTPNTRRRPTLDSPDPFVPTLGQVLARDLGDDYGEVFARVTGVPAWADEAPLSRAQRKWENFAAAVAAAGDTAAHVRRAMRAAR